MQNQGFSISKSVAVFGAGIAGLTAAHEFSKLNYKVCVYEFNPEAGGFFRSARIPTDRGMPSEYSWHGIGPWYHNVFEILKQIPGLDGSPLYESGVSRPIDFGVAPNVGKAQFDDSSSWMVDVKKMFRMSTKDKILWAWILLKVWSARKRSEKYYSTLNAKAVWGKYLGPLALKTWAACFGPWVGSDWHNVSLHQAGHFFRKQLITKPTYWHKGDGEGGAWKHGARSGWLLLNGPSSEVLFDNWVAHLKSRQVEFKWESKLTEFSAQGDQIEFAIVNDEKIIADIYVLAINPFVASEIIEKSNKLKDDLQLGKMKSLIAHGPHNQVSFRIAFKEKINWPRKRCAVVIADSEFNLTLFAQEQAWTSEVYLGENISSLWTATACVSKVPGAVHGIPLEKCTKDQFIEEVLFQLKKSAALNDLVKEANQGRGWESFEIVRVEVWHEWKFSPEGLQGRQPKWVNSTHTQEFMPEQKTSFKNLALAGAHTKTEVDVWSIEGAVESGKRAAKVFDENVNIVEQYKPLPLRALWTIDDLLYSLKLPNVIDVILLVTFVSLLVWIF